MWIISKNDWDRTRPTWPNKNGNTTFENITESFRDNDSVTVCDLVGKCLLLYISPSQWSTCWIRKLSILQFQQVDQLVFYAHIESFLGLIFFAKLAQPANSWKKTRTQCEDPKAEMYFSLFWSDNIRHSKVQEQLCNIHAAVVELRPHTRF